MHTPDQLAGHVGTQPRIGFFRGLTTRHPRLIYALIYFGLIWPTYVVVNRGEAKSLLPPHILTTPLDRAIPFVPWAFLLYASMHFLAMFPFVFIRDIHVYKRMFWSFAATGVIAFVFFLLYPVYDVLRPTLRPDTFADFYILSGYKHDSPYNCFPSLHVGYSLTAGLWLRFVDRSWFGWTMMVWGVLVAVSVLLVKEHYVADLVAGAILAMLCFAHNWRRLPASARVTPSRHSRWWLGLFLALYAVQTLLVYVSYQKLGH